MSARQSAVWRYGLAIGVTIAATFATIALPQFLAPMRLFFYWVAVLVTAVVAGVGPGLVAMALSVAGAVMFVFEPHGVLAVSRPIDMARLATFVAFATAIVVAAGLRRNAEARATALAERLRESELRYRTLVEAAPTRQAVWTATSDGKITWSDAWIAITGQSRADLESGGGMRAVHPEDAARTWEKWSDALAKKDRYEDELRVRDASGRYRWFRIRAVPVRGEDGALLEWVGVIADIHDRKQHEQQAAFLNRAGELLSSSLDVDQLLRDLTRLSVPALGDWCAIELTAGDTAARRVVEGEERGGAAVIAPMLARGRTLGLFSVGSATAEVPFIEDVAHRAAMAIDNAQLFEEAQRANRAKDEFLTTLSHELRTPLTSIAGWVAMLQMGGMDEVTVQTAIDTIARSARVQGELIDDLLDLSRVVAGKLHLDVAAVDLEPLIAEVVIAARPAAEAKSLALSYTSEQPAAIVRGDQKRLRQIAWNLISNAVKFTPDGGSVRVRLTTHGQRVRVEVTDDGRGIAPEFLPYVWERFRQADSSVTRQHGGLGLGLAVARELVELHGGTIVAESDGVGRGSTFAFELPLARALAQVSASPEARARKPLEGRRILVVDDDHESRTVIGAMLRHFGGDVLSAESAEAALRIATEQPLDAVVTDVAMPGEDGYSLLRRLREKTTIPIIAVSAIGSDPSDSERARAAGFTDFLRKPVEPQVLANTVARHL